MATHFHIILKAISICLLYGAACLSLGSLFVGLLTRNRPESGSFPFFGTAFLLGQAVLSGFWIFLAVPGHFSPAAIITVLIICAVGLPFGLRRASAGIPFLGKAARAVVTESLAWKAILLFTIALALLFSATCFLPLPIGDAAGYYMVFPKVIAASHTLTPLACYETMTTVGVLGEMHFAALMSIASPEAARFFPFLTGLSVLSLLISLGRSMGLNRYGAYTVTVVLFTSTAFTLVIGDGKVDLFAAALGIAAFYWAAAPEERWGRGKKMCLTGLFTGFAIVAKLSYVPVLLPGIIILVLWPSATRRPLLSRPALLGCGARMAMLAFWTVLPYVPQMVKNGFAFGAPFAPFFGVPSHDIFFQSWYSAGLTRRILFTYPFALTFGNYPMQYGNISPLALGFAPLILFARPGLGFKGGLLFRVSIAALIGLVLWVVLKPTVLAPRYILAPLLILTLPVAIAVQGLFARQKATGLLRKMAFVCLVFVLLLSFRQFGLAYGNARPFLSGKMAECDYTGTICHAMAAINRDAKPGDRVFQLSYITYYLRPDLLQCMLTEREKDMFVGTLKGPEARWDYLFDRGFRYILVCWDTHKERAEWLFGQPSRIPHWLEVRTVFDRDGYSVYRISSKDPGRRPAVVFRQTNPPAWKAVMNPEK